MVIAGSFVLLFMLPFYIYATISMSSSTLAPLWVKLLFIAYTFLAGHEIGLLLWSYLDPQPTTFMWYDWLRLPPYGYNALFVGLTGNLGLCLLAFGLAFFGFVSALGGLRQR